MPVFFYIDPDIDDDIYLEDLEQIILSYTFFEAKEGVTLPLPGFPEQKPNANPAWRIFFSYWTNICLPFKGLSQLQQATLWIFFLFIRENKTWPFM